MVLCGRLPPILCLLYRIQLLFLSCIDHFFAFLLLIVLSHFKLCSGIVLLYSLLLVVLGFWKRMSLPYVLGLTPSPLKSDCKDSALLSYAARSHLLCLPMTVPLSGYAIVHLSAHEWLPYLAITNDAAVNISVPVSWWTRARVSSGICLRGTCWITGHEHSPNKVTQIILKWLNQLTRPPMMHLGQLGIYIFLTLGIVQDSPVQYITTTGHVWLLSTWNVARVTKELNF